jgi:Transglutaminase-like superfamily
MSPIADERATSLSWPRKLALAGRIWRSLLGIELGLRRHGLVPVVDGLSLVRHSVAPLPARRWSGIVSRTLRAGPYRPRCLIQALVLFQLLRAQGEPAQLVIGLPQDGADSMAHAWVEVDGIDVGPAPGRDRHEELARYG